MRMHIDEYYSAQIFLKAVLPLFKVIADETPLKKGFEGKNGIVQISVQAGKELWGTHFVLEDGSIQVVLDTTEHPDVELRFKNLPAFNNFFKGKSMKLPKISGLKNTGLLIATFRVLLKMSALLGAKEIPQEEETKALMVKLYFYLLSSGISRLNKAGHKAIGHWAKMSPDRVYAFTVDGHQDLAAYIRVKAGKTRASRGRYTRSRPFYTMRFRDVDSALGILMEKDDLLESTAEGKLIMEGAPEFGAQLGDFMMLVGALAK